MPKGKTKSKYHLRERRHRAFQRFAQGDSDVSIARELGVSRQTVASYRKKYEASLDDAVASNPGFLQEVLTNTRRTLQELDMIRADAWRHLEPRQTEVIFECEECGHENDVVVMREPSDQIRVQYQNVLLKAQDQRNKLFGLMGVKQEVWVLVEQVKAVQEKLLQWMPRHLCATDRQALERFLLSDEMAPLMGASAQMAAIEATATEV